MPNKRIKKRTHKRLQIHFGVGTPSSIGFTDDISSDGLFIRSGIVHSPGHELLVEIQGETDTPIRLVGRIQWAKKVPPTMMRISKGGMGIHIIRFDSGEEHYRQLCVKLGAA